ncbi:putative dihydroorotate dehydrogenase, class 1/ 2 [Haemophilus haemolyticus M21639]|nr:putative dihydroorotate dehydrogenase, class 1/ 2 [Haemophilus haemolyticus M21639]
MYQLFRYGIFQMDAEKAHNFTIQCLKLAGNSLFQLILKSIIHAPKGFPKTVMRVNFPNPIRLAAGADKNGDAIDGFGALGFGFLEVGTVTPVAQDGNTKPRQFRLIEAEGIINRNGFNNNGIDYLIENVKNARYQGVIGINIGKNKFTPLEQGKDDYIFCLNKGYNYAGYITVNISSPNTPDLRQL